MISPKVVVDFSTFSSNANVSEVVIKELTIVDIETKCLQHYIFSPPDSASNWDTDRRWLSHHFHGLDFNLGFSNYDSLLQVLNYHTEHAKLIFTPTREKAKILENLFKTRRIVFDLETLGCPPIPREGLFPESLDDDSSHDYGVDETDSIASLLPQISIPEQTNVNPYRPCLFHHVNLPGYACTQSNAMYFAGWCSRNPQLINMNDPDVREKTFVNWKLSSPSARDLANSGFVRSSVTKDSTQCVYCGVVLYQWEYGDNAETDHEWNSPFCKLLRFKLQLKRQAEIDAKKAGRSAHKEDYCAEVSAHKEFYRRYGTCKDLTEEEVFSHCHA